MHLNVIIFEPHNYQHPGPVDCNGCAGILSSRLLNGLESLGISLPEQIIQSELHSYAAHLDGYVVHIRQPDPSRRIVSVYRGSGPRLVQGEHPASFDGYLLSMACQQGARQIAERVRRVEYEDRPVIYLAQERFTADLLVLATGVNSNPPLSPDFGYKRPKTELMAQGEAIRPLTWPVDEVGVYFRRPPGLVFGALIPKGKYMNISIFKHGQTHEAVGEFLEANGLEAQFAPANSRLCGCYPHIAVGPARTYFGDRWVAVGDAAVTRLYKDGNGSAFYTAKTAMQVAVRYGVSRESFQKGYAPFCQGITFDNLFGRFMFQSWDLALKTPRLLDAWKNAVENEARLSPEKRVHMRILWGMFTGDEFYRELFWLFLNGSAMSGLLRGLWRGSA